MFQKPTLTASAALILLTIFGRHNDNAVVTMAFTTSSNLVKSVHHLAASLQTTSIFSARYYYSSRPLHVSPSTNACNNNNKPKKIDDKQKVLFREFSWLSRRLADDFEQDATIQTVQDHDDNETAAASLPPVELLGMAILLATLSAFILMNQFVEPWPASVLSALPAPAWLLLHYLGGVLFAGGVVVTTALEWLVVGSAAAADVQEDSSSSSSSSTSSSDGGNPNKVAPVLEFLFERVPMLDACLVLPGLVIAIVSGVGVATEYYGSLGEAPAHIQYAFRALVAFAAWWAATDVSTQAKAAVAVQEWNDQKEQAENSSELQEFPNILYMRRVSNIGSCLFVVALYAIMALKPGTYF